MITKLSLLARNLPDLFRRLPAVTSVGYRMPHKRYFLAGISFSAALHAAVLFGIRPTPETPVLSRPDEPIPTPPGWVVVNLPPEEVLVPESKTDKDVPPPEEAADSGERASLPEPFANPVDRGFEFSLTKITPPIVPDTKRNNWNVPKNPFGSGTRVYKDRPFDPKDLDKIPVATSRVSPRYPYELKRTSASGTVLLRFVVDSRGNVSDVEVLRADYPEFGRNAAEAMLKWKFRPGMKLGSRVNTLMEMPMVFSLDSGT